MANYYSVFQYIPDGVRDERINVGIVVFGSGRVLTHFLNNWARVRHFASADAINDLRSIPNRIRRMTEEEVRSLAEKETLGIQLTRPAVSLLKDEELLYDSALRFLIDPPPAVHRDYIVKSELAHKVRRRIKEALVSRFGGHAGLLVKDDYLTPGRYGPHQFDVAIANGHVMAAAEAVSFEMKDKRQLDKDASAAIWKITDAHRANENLPLALVVTEPTEENREEYDSTRRAVDELSIEVVTDTGLDGWARNLTGRIRIPRARA
jgi:hypothetical protein